MFKDKVTSLWEQIKEQRYDTTDERYGAYTLIMNEALQAARRTPRLSDKSFQLIKLKQ